jgi:hypothetical protein
MVAMLTHRYALHFGNLFRQPVLAKRYSPSMKQPIVAGVSVLIACIGFKCYNCNGNAPESADTTWNCAAAKTYCTYFPAPNVTCLYTHLQFCCCDVAPPHVEFSLRFTLGVICPEYSGV